MSKTSQAFSEPQLPLHWEQDSAAPCSIRIYDQKGDVMWVWDGAELDASGTRSAVQGRAAYITDTINGAAAAIKRADTAIGWRLYQEAEREKAEEERARQKKRADQACDLLALATLHLHAPESAELFQLISDFLSGAAEGAQATRTGQRILDANRAAINRQSG